MEKLSHFGHRKRLRERYLRSGLKSLAEHEILELIITYAIPRMDCKPLSKRLLSQFKNLNGVLNADKDELLEVQGFGEMTLSLVKLIKDVNKFYIKNEIIEKSYINSTKDLLDFLKIDISYEKKEIFKIILLNSKNIFLDEKNIFEGTLDKSSVYPRELVKYILNKNAKSVIFVHNHPSGCTKPSEKDIIFTKKMKEIFFNIEIRLLDHLIVSKGEHFSFLENELI